MPVGCGEATTGRLVDQVCQPPVSPTGNCANGVAVGESSRSWTVPPESAAPDANRTCTSVGLAPVPKLTLPYFSRLCC